MGFVKFVDRTTHLTGMGFCDGLDVVEPLARPAVELFVELSRCAWQTLRRGLSMAIGDADAVPGALLSRATAGDLMNAHPHLHALVSCGAWSERGRGETFLPWPSHLTGARLEALFQRKVLTMIVRRERLASETAQRLMGWNPTGFSVWVGDPIEPNNTLSRHRLARYITKAPVALERMEHDKQNCIVHYRSFSQGRSRTATVLDFLADLSVHVPNRGEHGVSYFGRHSSRSRGERRKAWPAPVDPTTPNGPPPPPPSRKAFRIAWARLLEKVWKVDVLRCPRCGGHARVVAAVVHSKDVARLLDHLGIHPPRPPRRHDCPPAPGAQALLPLAPPATHECRVEGPRLDDLDDEWPTDPPFQDD